MKANSLPVVVVVPGDLHLTEAGRANHRAALWMVDEVNRLVRPDLVQFIVRARGRRRARWGGWTRGRGNRLRRCRRSTGVAP